MAQSKEPSAQARTVLVVEDDASITLGLEMNLTAEGYRVVLAQDGEAILDAPDFAILP